MSTLLKLIGILTGVVTLVVGIFPVIDLDYFGGTLVWMVAGAIQVLIYFAIAKVLDNQDDMLGRLRYIEQNLEAKKRTIGKKKICSNCGKSYEEDCTSCPYCGYKE